ncbi:MAG TPA: hypothetical protein VK168_01195 [Saprospiraceae bacterium]|nr:hypothetical protein [Saprospiraceae bacterium]
MEQDFDKDLDGSFAEDLRKAGRDSKPIPREWLQLAAQLDAYDYQKSQRRQKWLWLILALLLLSNLWTGFQLNHLKADMAKLPGIQTPTAPAYTRERVVILDTVYQTLVIQRKEYVFTENQSRNNAGVSYLPSANAIPDSNTSERLSHHNTSGNTQYLAASTPNLTTPDSTATVPLGLPVVITPTEPEVRKTIWPDTLQNPELTKAENKEVSKRLKPQRKKWGYRVGLSGGGLHVLNSREDETPAAWLAQGQAELLWGNHWSVASTLTFAHQSLELNPPADPRWMLKLPTTPNPDYTFQHLEGSLQFWLPGIQLKYYFRPEKAVSWYLGSGYAARIYAESELETEYYDPASNLEIKVEAHQQIPSRWANVTGQFGAAWRPGQSRWQVFVDGNGVFDLGNGQRTFPLGFIQAGIKWGTR